MSQKFPQSASGSSNSAAEQGATRINTLLLDSDMELTASDTIQIEAVEMLSVKKKNTLVAHEVERNPETQNKPTGTSLQTGNCAEQVQPCVQRSLPRKPKLKQPQAGNHLKMANDNAFDPPGSLAISATSNFPNVVISVLDDCFMDPDEKSSRAKETAKCLSEKGIPEGIRTLIPSGDAVPEVSVVIQDEASPGVVTYYNLHAL